MSDLSSTLAAPSVQANAKAGLLWQTTAAAVLGLTLLFAVGFMPMEAAHNAAHDVRHALAFPCH